MDDTSRKGAFCITLNAMGGWVATRPHSPVDRAPNAIFSCANFKRQSPSLDGAYRQRLQHVGIVLHHLAALWQVFGMVVWPYGLVSFGVRHLPFYHFSLKNSLKTMF